MSECYCSFTQMLAVDALGEVWCAGEAFIHISAIVECHDLLVTVEEFVLICHIFNKCGVGNNILPGGYEGHISNVQIFVFRLCY